MVAEKAFFFSLPPDSPPPDMADIIIYYARFLLLLLYFFCTRSTYTPYTPCANRSRAIFTLTLTPGSPVRAIRTQG